MSTYTYAQNFNALYAKLNSAKGDTSKLNSLNKLTNAYIGYKNDSAKYFNELSLKLSDQKTLYNFDGLLNRAVLFRKEKNKEEAEKFAKKALELSKSSNNQPNTAEALEMLALLNEQSKNYEIALQYILRALSINQELQDTSQLVSNLTIVGSIFKKSEKTTEALKYYLQGLRYAEKIKDTDAQFNIYINLGTLYEFSDDSHKALQFYKNALEINKISQDENGLAICYYKMGAVYSRHKKYDSAYIYMKKVVDIHLHQKNEIGLLKSYTMIGGILTSLGRYDEGISYLKKVKDLCVKYSDTVQMASANNGIGQNYYLKGDLKEGIRYLQLAANYFLNGKTPELGFAVYDRLSKAFAKSGDYKNAYNYHELFVTSRDTMNNRKDVKKQTEIKLAYEFDKIQDRQKEEAKAKQIENDLKLKQEKQRRYYLWALLILACGVIIVAFRSYINKRKANYKLEKQKVLIEFQKQLVEEKNKEINDSINYAHHIQTACLPGEADLAKLFDKYYVLNKPRDVVSGDFYWTTSTGENIFFAVADCTGHGVPGAIMSMIGSILLNEVFYIKKIYSPELMLKELNRMVKLTLHQKKNSRSRDGMDIALCCWNKNTNELLYSGANRPLYLINEIKELIEIKPSKIPVGGDTESDQDYELNKLMVKPGYQIILSSDGYADQFGGEKFKKVTTKRFKNKLVEISNETVSIRNKLLEKYFVEWKAENEQTDDVLVFGIDVI